MVYISPSVDPNDEVIKIRVRNIWIGNGAVAFLGSIFSGPLVGSNITHWWVEIETKQAWYCAQFNGSRELALTKHSSCWDVTEQGKSAAGSRGESKDITTRDSYDCSGEGICISDIVSFMKSFNGTYNLVTNNCQHFAISLHQMVSGRRYKIQGGILLGGGTSVWKF